MAGILLLCAGGLLAAGAALLLWLEVIPLRRWLWAARIRCAGLSCRWQARLRCARLALDRLEAFLERL